MSDASPYEAATGLHVRRLSGQPVLASVEMVLQHTSDELAEKFAGVFARETIDRYVHESYVALYRTATVKTHLPTFTYRFALERLTALAQNHGAVAKDVPEVLFMCAQNAGRSQMAAALLDHYAGDRVHIRTAGSTPAGMIDEAVAGQAIPGLGPRRPRRPNARRGAQDPRGDRRSGPSPALRARPRRLRSSKKAQ